MIGSSTRIRDWVLTIVVGIMVGMIAYSIQQNDDRAVSQQRQIDALRAGLEAQGQILSAAVARQDAQYTEIERQLAEILRHVRAE